MIRRLACAVAVLGGAGCTGDLTDLASFLGDPFGDISDEVRDLDEPQLEALMSTLMIRFRLYLALREAIPFESVAPDECLTAVQDTGEAFNFVASVPCTFGESADPAEGEIAVSQQQLAATPVAVFRFIFDYRDVVVGDIEVNGSETIRETEGSDGASVRRLDLTQNGIELAYEFRAGILDGETPVFDYELAGPGGTVLARISNPQTTGGFVSVFLTGLDGTLTCEVRNSLWTPERLPRGSCDNGVVFGLPP